MPLLLVDSSTLLTEHLFFNAGLIEKLSSQARCNRLSIICSNIVKPNYESIYTRYSSKPFSIISFSQRLLSSPLLFSTYLLFSFRLKKVIFINPSLCNLFCALALTFLRRDLRIDFFLHGALTDKLVRPKHDLKTQYLSNLLLLAIRLSPHSFRLVSLSLAIKNRLPRLGKKLICFNSHAIPSNWPQEISRHYGLAKTNPSIRANNKLVISFIGNFTEYRGAKDFLLLAKTVLNDTKGSQSISYNFRVIGSTMMLNESLSDCTQYIELLDDGEIPHIPSEIYYSNLLETDLVFFSPTSPDSLYRASSVQMEAISFGIPVITLRDNLLLRLADNQEYSSGWSFQSVEEASSWIRRFARDDKLYKDKLMQNAILQKYYLDKEFYRDLTV